MYYAASAYIRLCEAFRFFFPPPLGMIQSNCITFSLDPTVEHQK